MGLQRVTHSAFRFHTNTQNKKSKSLSSFTPQPSENTCVDQGTRVDQWSHLSLPERCGEEAGDLWVWRIICCLSVSLFLTLSVWLLCCSLLDRQRTWVGTESRATIHLFKSTRKEVTCNTSETGMKGVLSLYGNARWLQVKVTPVPGLRDLVTCFTVSEGSLGLSWEV